MTNILGRASRYISTQVRRLKSAARTFSERYYRRATVLRTVEGAFPKRLRARTLYVLTEDGTPWQASMICPCGCGATLELNLLPDERPLWRYSTDSKGRATLAPSVWRHVGCKSHFWLRDGRIIWV